MPAMICHWLLGHRVLKRLEALPDPIKLEKDCFLWGCQGPDIFFFHRMMPYMTGENLRRYGNRMHDDSPSRLFAELSDLLSQCSLDRHLASKSYILGMCCHYAYDRTAHPYVIQLEERMKNTDPRGSEYYYHGEIESMLDVILLRHEREQLMGDIHLTDCLPKSKAADDAVDQVYRRLLLSVYGDSLSKKAAAQLTRDFRSAARWLNDSLLIKRPLTAKFERFAGKAGRLSAFMRPLMEDMEYDYANVGHEQWSNIHAPEEKSCADFFELTDIAENFTLSFIDFFLQSKKSAKELAVFTEDRTFSYGVPPLG